MKMTRLAALMIVLILIPVSLSAEKKPLYKNPKAPIEERVEDLLNRMTLAENAHRCRTGS